MQRQEHTQEVECLGLGLGSCNDHRVSHWEPSVVAEEEQLRKDQTERWKQYLCSHIEDSCFLVYSWG
jgi:hypothetical protein